MDTELVVVGGGCAGLTAALYAARAGAKVLVLEAMSVGGQISYSPRVENYPGIAQISGSAFADALYEQVTALGVELLPEQVVRVEKTQNGFLVHTDSDTHACGSVVLATGTHHRLLGVEREEDLVGRGVSYCAICDGAFFKGQRVAVVGGGDTAFQAARLLAKDCSKVCLIHRRKEFRAEQRLVAQVLALPNVEQLTPATVQALEGENALTGVCLAFSDGTPQQTLPVTGLFVSVGQIPDNQPFADLVELDSTGYIRAGEDCVTSCPGVFAAGDCRTKQIRQLTTAAADGAVSALAACEYLDNQTK